MGHGFPRHIISDRAAIFTSKFWKNFLAAFQISHRTSVTAHHQSNGKVERKIQVLQQYLRLFIDSNPQWCDLLPIAEFTINSTPSIPLGNKSPLRLTWDITLIAHRLSSITWILHLPLDPNFLFRRRWTDLELLQRNV